MKYGMSPTSLVSIRRELHVVILSLTWPAIVSDSAQIVKEESYAIDTLFKRGKPHQVQLPDTNIAELFFFPIV
jgi:hypothetical protein